MAKTATKEKAPSLQEAAEAFIYVHDSGNFSGRKYERFLGMLRDAVKGSSNMNVGPFEPDERRPEVEDGSDLDQAVKDRLIEGSRVDDLLHPGSRVQKGDEALAEVQAQMKDAEGNEDGARKLAREAKEKAEEKKDEDKKDAEKTENATK
jgi:hypothetical protein